jgi:hypothetical protein
METAVCRLRQMVANIEARRKAARQHQQTIAEWQTRTLATFIAATVPQEKKGAKNPLLEEAQKVRLQMEGEESEDDKAKDVPPEVFIEQGSQVAQNRNGSYERLRRAFGA